MKFLTSINYFIWLIVSGIFFAMGEFLSKKFAIQPRGMLVFFILLSYSIGVLAWLPAILAKNQLSIVGALWTVIGLLTTVLIGVLIFGEKLNGIGIAGIVVALIAIFLLSMN
jgi:multidrug transporter EmrE-like cation transporter